METLEDLEFSSKYYKYKFDKVRKERNDAEYKLNNLETTLNLKLDLSVETSRLENLLDNSHQREKRLLAEIQRLERCVARLTSSQI